MPIVHLEDVPAEPFRNGATYQTVVGDDAGTTPVRIGIQTSPPGYSTGTHSHPYMEVLTVLEGEGEAWMGDDKPVAVGPGTTLVLPAGVPHGFRVTGNSQMRTYGVHASSERIVAFSDVPDP